MVRSTTRRTADEWDALVQQQRDSGLSIAEFSRREGLVYQTFVGKCRRRRDVIAERTQAVAPLPDFVELGVAALSAPARSDWWVELDLGNGIQLRVRQPG